MSATSSNYPASGEPYIGPDRPASPAPAHPGYHPFGPPPTAGPSPAAAGVAYPGWGALPTNQPPPTSHIGRNVLLGFALLLVMLVACGAVGLLTQAGQKGRQAGLSGAGAQTTGAAGNAPQGAATATGAATTPPAPAATTPAATAAPHGALTSFGDGTFPVGTADGAVTPGTYRTTVPASSINCYVARLSGLSGDLNDIIANHNYASGASATVTVKDTDKGVDTSGGCVWTKLS